MALLKDIEVGDVLMVGAVTLRLQSKSGKKARIRIDAPPDMYVIVEREVPVKT